MPYSNYHDLLERFQHEMDADYNLKKYSETKQAYLLLCAHICEPINDELTVRNQLAIQETFCETTAEMFECELILKNILFKEFYPEIVRPKTVEEYTQFKKSDFEWRKLEAGLRTQRQSAILALARIMD